MPLSWSSTVTPPPPVLVHASCPFAPPRVHRTPLPWPSYPAPLSCSKTTRLAVGEERRPARREAVGRVVHRRRRAGEGAARGVEAHHGDSGVAEPLVERERACRRARTRACPARRRAGPRSPRGVAVVGQGQEHAVGREHLGAVGVHAREPCALVVERDLGRAAGAQVVGRARAVVAPLGHDEPGAERRDRVADAAVLVGAAGDELGPGVAGVDESTAPPNWPLPPTAPPAFCASCVPYEL